MPPCGIIDRSDASFAPVHFPTNMEGPDQPGGSMAIAKCINGLDPNEVIFEEGSTGREMFVVLDGKVGISEINGSMAIAATPNTGVMQINHARSNDVIFRAATP
jgi:hypothetical protein